MANDNPTELIGASPQSSFNAFPVANIPAQFQGRATVNPLLNNSNSIQLISTPVDDGTQKLLGKIGANSEDDANPLLKYINVNDFINAATPGGLTNADYYPGQSVSPVDVKASQGSRWNNLPQITGGQVLIPFGLQDARKKALQDAAAKKAADNIAAKKENNPFDIWKQQLGKPAYQPQIDKMFQDKIMTPYEEGYDKYGELYTNMITPGTDMFDPKEYNKYIKSYQEYQGYTAATKVLDDAVENYQKVQMQNPNAIIDNDTQAIIDEYNSGTMSPDRILKCAKTLNYRYNFTQVSDKYADKIGGDVISWFQDVKDVNGNPIDPTQTNKKQFLDLVYKTGENNIDAYVDMISRDPNLGSQYRDKKEIKSWLQGLVKDKIESHFNQISYPQTQTNNYNIGGTEKNNFKYPVNVTRDKFDGGVGSATHTVTEKIVDPKTPTLKDANGNTFPNYIGVKKSTGTTDEQTITFPKFEGLPIQTTTFNSQGVGVPQKKTIAFVESRMGVDGKPKLYLHTTDEQYDVYDDKGQKTGEKLYDDGTEIKDIWTGLIQPIANGQDLTPDNIDKSYAYYQTQEGDIESIINNATPRSNTVSSTTSTKTTAPPPKTTTPTNTPASSAKMVVVIMADGSKGNIPEDQLAAFLKKYPNAHKQ